MLPSRRSSTAAKKKNNNNSNTAPAFYNKGKSPQRTPSLKTRTRRQSPDRPRPSKTLPRELEDELRVLVFDIGDARFNGEPTLIVGNPDTNCHALFWAKPDRTEIVFHHGRLKEKADPTGSVVATRNPDKVCGCMVRGGPETTTLDIPQALDEYRIELILGIARSGIKMEPKLAAMVVMKLFLGMEVPEALRMDP